MRNRDIEEAFKDICSQINGLKKEVKKLQLERCAKGSHGPLEFYDAHGKAKEGFGGYVRYLCKNCGCLVQVSMVDSLQKFFESPELLRIFNEQRRT